MENLKVCLNAVLPMFLMMVLGYIAKRASFLSEEDVPRFNNIAFRIFLPCLVFYNIYNSDLSSAVKPRLILFAVCAVLAVYLASLLFVLTVEKTTDRRGVMIQGLFRSNYVVIGLPIATALVGAGSLGPVTVLIAVVVPIFNILAVTTLETFCGKRIRPAAILLSITKNPLIISTALGILAVALDVELPEFLFTAVKDIGAAATPLQLFLLGAFFRFSGMAEYFKALLTVVIGRLIVIPGAVLLLAVKLGFLGTEFAALIGCFASSTAISSFTMTQQMGGDAKLAGYIVVITSALCPITIFCWAYLFRSLGIF